MIKAIYNLVTLQLSQLLTVITLLLSVNAVSQVYPVQLSTQLVPPYSGYLTDYADPSSEKLKIFLQFNDLTKPQYEVKLKIEIKGNGFTLSTKQFFNPPPILLQAGVPLLITGSDLAPYLNSNNLDFSGISQNQYEQRMALPEGHYSICIKAFDYYSPTLKQVSNESCSQAWFTLSNPPMLNMPLCNQVVSPLTPQNIIFQWTPVNIGSPNSANNTEYDFALWEVKPDTNANPNQVILSTAPIFSMSTNMSMINYGITEPTLNLYMKYVWRVRARDLSGRDWFANNGYSQICTFTYGNLTNVLGNTLNLNLSAQGITHRLGLCTWNSQTIYTNYKLQVRKKNTSNWFDYNTTSASEKVTNLEPDTDYEARVRGEGSNLTGEWSNIAEFRTLSAPVYGCGDQTQLTDPLQPAPLPVSKAKPGLIVQSGQFEVLISQITPNGNQGWYSGKGYAKVFNLPVAVQFSNIYIDDNNRHQQGIIEAITEGIKSWTHQWDVQHAEENASYVSSGTIENVYVNSSNQICVNFTGAQPDSCFEMPTGQNVVVVRDGDGNQITIQVIPPPPVISGPTNYFKPSDDNLEAGDSTKVVFEESVNRNFGFDLKKHAAWANNYELIKISGGKNYFVPYAGIGENQTDKVIAKIDVINFVAAKLNFKTKGGQTCAASVVSNGDYEVTVPANADAVYAWYNNKKIGKLNVISLKAIQRKLVLVPVNNASVNGQAINSTALNNIFKQANVSFNITVKPSFSYSLGTNGLEAADATLMTKYSTQMRALRDAYRKYDSLYDKEAYYIFVVNNFSDPNLKGYMVRGRSLGFIRADATAKDLAHELAHGAFGLEHTFPTIPKSSSNNLMDYNQGTELGKMQWLEMQNRPPMFVWVGDDEEDASFSENRNILLKLLTNIKNSYKENTTFNMGTTWQQLYVDKTYLAGIDYDYINVFKGCNKSLLNPKKGIIQSITTPTLAASNSAPTGNNYIIVDSCLQIGVPPNRVANMIAYLKSTLPTKNLLLFVNGYRPIINLDGSGQMSILEYANSDNTVNITDTKNYWKGIDADFINRIGTRNVVYADGNYGVYTSNHLTIQKFAGSAVSSIMAQKLFAGILINVFYNGNLTYSSLCGNCYHVDTCVHLNTAPNTAGFSVRKSGGVTAGYELLNKINNGNISFDKANETIDIVCHSMGYAYAVGMIKALKTANVKFGRLYIIAPENPTADGEDWSMFEEVWQYGSNLDRPNRDPMWEQDGVAPQAPVKGIEGLPNSTTKGGRIFIPNDVKKDFLESHTISNYKWIFNRKSTEDGYVKKR